MPRTIKSTDTVSASSRIAKRGQFPFANDGAAFNMKRFTSSEEKTLNEVTRAWFDKQPITGIGGARRFQNINIRYTTFKELCSGIVEGGWTVNQPIHRPTLYPCTFKDKALLVGTLKEDVEDYPEKGIHLKEGAYIWALPQVNDQRDDVSIAFKTEKGITVPNHVVKLKPHYQQRAQLWAYVLFHHDDCESRRITEYNLKLAVAIFRERLKESVNEDRELSDIELSHRVPATGFEFAKLATPVFDDRVLKNTLNRRGPPPLGHGVAQAMAFTQSSTAS